MADYFAKIADARKAREKKKKTYGGRIIIRRLSSTERKAHKGKNYKLGYY